jgi:hypothetical protein
MRPRNPTEDDLKVWQGRVRSRVKGHAHPQTQGMDSQAPGAAVTGAGVKKHISSCASSPHQRFFIACRLPGMNEIIKASKMRSRTTHWNGYAALKELTEAMIKVDIRHAKLKPITGKVMISLHWMEPNARRDFGNIRAGEKFVSDALVSAGILKTDARSQVVGFLDTFAVDKTNPGCWVSLEEVP